jgi:sulfoxide reductase heme-binding subunit YedZ
MIPNNNIEPAELAAVAASRCFPATRRIEPAPPRTDCPAARLQRRIGLANQTLVLLCLLPLLMLSFRYAGKGLGPNPVETLAGDTGAWALRLLWISLAVSPLRQLTGWHWLVRLRRVPALFGFFYAGLHLLVYLVFEQEFDAAGVFDDIRHRPYILAGFAAFLCLTPLAITSTDAMIKRLGGRKWRTLHRLSYAAAILAALHFLLLVKRDITEPAIYIALLGALFLARLRKHPARARLALVRPPPVVDNS